MYASAWDPLQPDPPTVKQPQKKFPQYHIQQPIDNHTLIDERGELLRRILRGDPHSHGGGSPGEKGNSNLELQIQIWIRAAEVRS